MAVPTISQATESGIAYRECLPDGWDGIAADGVDAARLPDLSYLWRNVLPAGRGGRLPRHRDRPARLRRLRRPTCPAPGSARSHNVERFRQALGLDKLVLVVHDWGGLIGLRWACDNPGAVTALAILDTGFFPEGRWHGMAKALQTEGEGEVVLENMNRELFGMGFKQVSPNAPDDAIDEYWKAYGDDDRKQNQLDLYRSGDFAKIEPYRARSPSLACRRCCSGAPRTSLRRSAADIAFNKQIPHSKLVVLDEAGHFLMEDEPERVGAELREFLTGIG